MAGMAVIEHVVNQLERGHHLVPVVQRLLQRSRNLAHRLAEREIAADDRQGAVTTAVLEGGKLHALAPAFA